MQEMLPKKKKKSIPENSISVTLMVAVFFKWLPCKNRNILNYFKL